MPKSWYDVHSVIPSDDDNDYVTKKKAFDKQIVADKKPYFMIYVYPQLKREYRKFIESARKSCQSEFGIRLDELLAKTDRDEKQEEFVKWYYKKYPVSDENGVMNRLCHYVEKEFEGYLHSVKVKDYPFRELLASEDYGTDYIGKEKIDKIKELYTNYKERMQDISILTSTVRKDKDEILNMKLMLSEQFKRECGEICASEKKLCDVLLKLCYSNEQSKRFVWDMCGERIVRNLLEKNGGYSYFVRDNGGDVEYGGNMYTKVTGYIDSNDCEVK